MLCATAALVTIHCMHCVQHSTHVPPPKESPPETISFVVELWAALRHCSKSTLGKGLLAHLGHMLQSCPQGLLLPHVSGKARSECWTWLASVVL